VVSSEVGGHTVLSVLDEYYPQTTQFDRLRLHASSGMGWRVSSVEVNSCHLDRERGEANHFPRSWR